MTYRDTVVKLATSVEAQVVAAYSSWTEGLLTDEEFVAVVAAFVAAGNSRAAALADLSLAAAVSVAVSRPVPPLGLVAPADDAERLTRAARTLLTTLDDTPDPPGRVARLGRSEPLNTAGRAYSEGMARSTEVVGYRRRLSAGACQLCVWLAKEGYTYPASRPMYQHPGCTCSPDPVVR